MFFYKPLFASTTYYAQAIDAQTYFYAEPTNSDSFKMFNIPQTYFVELLSSTNDTFYSARYQDIYGYVLKSQIKPVKNVPITPFLNDVTFRIFVPSGADLRSTPYNSGTVNLLYSIPFLDNNISYYGTMSGEEAISKKGNTWYFCKYYTGNLSYTGYVYAPLCDCLSAIPNNTESVEYLENSQITFEQNNISQTTGEPFEGLSQTATTVIIIAVSLPCLLLIYLLFKPSKMAEQLATAEEKQSKTYKKKKITRLKNSDYFELDDDF